jgi:hypothetical protein
MLAPNDKEADEYADPLYLYDCKDVEAMDADGSIDLLVELFAE